MWVVYSLCLVFTVTPLVNTNPVNESKWWSNSIIYQIYPWSFKDSNGDGIGDLKGITNQLEHVSEIADTIWLSPIYPSPQRDFGYDIADYKDIYPKFGTLKEFDELVKKAKSLGLRVLLDFVPNHCSNEHEWFKKSIERIQPYDDYFIWRNATYSDDGKRLPPNNWLSQFSSSAWSWNEKREQYYYHQYGDFQPDLNYRNSHVQQEMKDVIQFWLDRGIDGFRVDAVAHLFEDRFLRDEPRSKKDVPSTDYNYLDHIYTRDLNETYDIVKSWKVFMDEYSEKRNIDEKLAMMEVGSSLPFVMKYYDIDVDPFNFGFLVDLNNDSSASDFKTNIDNWMNNMPKGKIANWIVGNHDTSRVASRFGYKNNKADQMSMLSTILPGVTIIYNGDEIGMVNRFFTYNETVDPAGINAGPERYQLKSRDPQRTPYQWDDTVSAGFSTNLKTWLSVNDNYKTLNLAEQKKADISHYKVFKALFSLKKTSILKKDTYESLLFGDKVLAIIRRSPAEIPVILLINFSNDSIEVDVSEWTDIPKKLSVYVASVKSGLKSGTIMYSSQLLVPGSSSVIFTSPQLASILTNIV